MTLQEVLTGLVAGGLTVPVVSWLLNQAPTVSKNTKRYLAIALSFLLGAWGVSCVRDVGVHP